MIGIIKSKSGMMARLFVYQIAMSLLGLFVVSPFSGKMTFAAAIFSSLFYFSLIVYAVIEDGQKDYISASIGKIAGNSNSGFVYSTISYLPTIVIVLAQMILFLFTGQADFTGIKAIFAVIIRFFLMGMYLGFDIGLTNRTQDPITHMMVTDANESVLYICNNYILFAVLLLLMPLVCGITYKLAFNGKIHVNTEVKKKK